MSRAITFSLNIIIYYLYSLKQNWPWSSFGMWLNSWREASLKDLRHSQEMLDLIFDCPRYNEYFWLVLMCPWKGHLRQACIACIRKNFEASTWETIPWNLRYRRNLGHCYLTNDNLIFIFYSCSELEAPSEWGDRKP